MRVCAVVPAYNESQNIGRVIKALRGKSFDVVVVDDGSSDATGSIARDQGAFVIRHDHKQGKGASLQEGFRYAVARDFEGVITIDGDGQHDIEDIDGFMEVARAYPVSIIVGNRMADSKNMPFVRYCTNRFMSWLISVVCGRRIADTQCGYRYISCDILRELHLTSHDYEIETEILMKACKRGFKVYDVPVKTIYAGQASHINPLKDTLRFFTYFFKETFLGRH